MRGEVDFNGCVGLDKFDGEHLESVWLSQGAISAEPILDSFRITKPIRSAEMLLIKSDQPKGKKAPNGHRK